MSQQELSLKYDLLNSQMNPHFINNAIQSICNSITKGNVHQSINWLNKLSSLYRLVQKSTKYKLIDLEDELSISTLYIELQRELFDKKFTFSIEIDTVLQKNIEHTKVPPLILQPLIENAIVHGLKNRKNKDSGELKISLTQNENFLHACVIDNGNGIEKIKKKSVQHDGISLENINARLQIINGDRTETNFLEVTTLKHEDGTTKGTQSCVRIPLWQL